MGIVDDAIMLPNWCRAETANAALLAEYTDICEAPMEFISEKGKG